MDTATLNCFGVGDGFPTADRGHSSYLYRLGKATLLLDCGEPATARYKAANLPADLPDAICLSHTHADHIGGFLLFIQGLWLSQRRRPLAVHAPGGNIQILRQLLDAAYLFDELIGFPVEFVPWQPGRAAAINGVRITPFPTSHLDSIRVAHQARHPQTYECFSFLLEGAGRRIVHSADLGAPDDLTPLLGQPVDLLVCELAHYTPEQLFSFLAGRTIQRLVLIHLGARYWEAGAEVLAAARKALPKTQVAIAQAGQELAF
jgi:ribonuclease Z